MSYLSIMKNQESKANVQITHPDIEQYAEKMTTNESEAAKLLIKQSASELEFIDMLSGKLVAQLLIMLIKISAAKSVLEIGTFTGYSALKMAEALPNDGKIITIELNERYQEIAESHLKQFDSGHKITLLKGDARELVNEIRDSFDFIFIDADKISYTFYYKSVIELLKPGGLLVADNVLWGGSVLDPEDEKSTSLHDFNKLVKDDDRVEQILLPVRDGITILIKK